MASMNSSFDTDTAVEYAQGALDQFQKIPGSSILIRYIRSSYQDDPVRSAVELFLFLFAVYYLLAPTYSTKKQAHVPLTDEVGCTKHGRGRKS